MPGNTAIQGWLKRFGQIVSLHTRVRIILQRHLQLITLFFIKRTRLETGRIHQRMSTAFMLCLDLGRFDRPRSHARLR
jgi:hypothetical protein